MASFLMQNIKNNKTISSCLNHKLDKRIDSLIYGFQGDLILEMVLGLSWVLIAKLSFIFPCVQDAPLKDIYYHFQAFYKPL